MPNALVRNAVDAFVRQNRPAENFGDLPRLAVRGGTGTIARSFIFFALPFPLEANVVEATLRLRLRTAFTGQTVAVRRLTSSWKRRRVTWDNQPTDTGTDVDSKTVTGSAGDLVEFNVTSILADAAAGAAYFGFFVRATGATDRAFHSSRAADALLRPELAVTWSEDPQPPIDLRPSGGRAFSVARPTVSWSFRDLRGVESQASFKLQVSTSPTDFSSPVYDSGTVASAETRHEIGTDLSLGTTYYWRVRATDGAGLTSGYSDVAEMIRRAHGTLAIASPADSPDNFVEETTPPILHTFSGQTQERVQHTLFEQDDDGDFVVVFQDAAVTTDTSRTLPAGLLRRRDHPYRIRVRVFDTIARERLPGDPDFVDASRDFTFKRSATPSPVATLTATPRTDPGIDLTFTRATAPDFFALRVNGVIVDDRIDPADVFDSGTTYKMTFWGAVPRTATTYEVEAVVEDGGKLKHSQGNATAVGTTEPSGVWLMFEDGTQRVRIAGVDAVDQGIGEDVTTYYPRGRRDPVTRTTRVGGYEGTVSGLMVTHAGVAASTFRDRLERIAGRRRARCRLLFDNHSLIVQVRNIHLTKAGDANVYTVSFEFAQVDGFTFQVK